MPRRPVRDIAVATAAASALSGGPSTVHAVLTGRNVLDSARAAGTLLPGRADRPDLVAGGIVHAALSAMWGLVLGTVLPRRRTVVWGALAGFVIAAISLPTVGKQRDAIAALPQVPQWLDHIAFGALIGWLLSRSDAATS